MAKAASLTGRPRLLKGGAFFLLLASSLLNPGRVQGQLWNGQRALELVGDARALRHNRTSDPDFRSYSSQARGYVHFFLDRRDTNERILVKTDQIALEVYWRSPDETRQRIVGLRDEKSLPTNIHYHLDHLTVVQDEFGDRIRIGDGDEVEAVLHPVAPGAEAFYDFALGDSITLTLQGVPEPLVVYEVLVRPKDPDQPAFIGSVFLDKSSSAIVRMSFTFTPASYEDAYLDHISISLENGLWEGRYWLPYRQQLEIRREVPWLDIPAGTVIKGWFEIRDYEINPPLPPRLFQGPAITALPETARRAFPFEDSLHARLDEEGLLPPPEMSEIRSMASELSRDRFLSGLRKSRLHLPRPILSSALRYTRSEGLFLGGGISMGISPFLATTVHGGVAFGRERPQLLWTLTGGERAPNTGVSVFLDNPRDMGPIQGAPGLLNSFSTLALEGDYGDLYFASGLQLDHRWVNESGLALGLQLRWEEQRKGRNEISSFGDWGGRTVLETAEGSWKSLDVRLSTPTPWRGLTFSAQGLVGDFEGDSFGEFRGGLTFQKEWLTRGEEVQALLMGGTLTGRPPCQALYLMGGRETVPGYPYRSRAADGFWLLHLLGARDILTPWLRLRAFGAAGGTGYRGRALSDEWPAAPASSFLVSGGLGLGLGWDVLHLDLARGFREGGEWELIFSVNHAFWYWL